jgi:hypothetical protein
MLNTEKSCRYFFELSRDISILLRLADVSHFYSWHFHLKPEPRLLHISQTYVQKKSKPQAFGRQLMTLVVCSSKEKAKKRDSSLSSVLFPLPTCCWLVLRVFVFTFTKGSNRTASLNSSIAIGMKSCQLITVSQFVIVTGSPEASEPREKAFSARVCLVVCDEQQIKRQTRYTVYLYKYILVRSERSIELSGTNHFSIFPPQSAFSTFS